MKITMLGTGNALVTRCYNTCFVIENSASALLVDGGGGNGVLSQLEKAGLRWQDMRRIFVTHKHIDHILGIIWMMRLIAQNMNAGKYDGDAYIYSHSEVIELLRDMAQKLLQPKQAAMIDTRLHLVTVEDGETVSFDGFELTAFDIRSTKAKQFGFTLESEGIKLTCCGDEPFNECELTYAEGSDWLLHEAFCLYGEADIFKPYEKNHSTVKDACELAEKLGVKNVILYHSEDKNLDRRRELYTAEGRQYFSGGLFVPDDLQVLELD